MWILLAFPAILYGDYIREYDSQTSSIIYNATGSGVAKSGMSYNVYFLTVIFAIVFFAGDTLFAG